MSLLPLWYKGLNQDLRRHAELTIGETEELRTKSLAQFRKLLSEQRDINARQDDVFLLQFLRTKKFDVKKAFQLLRNFYTFKTKHNGTYAGFKPSEMRNIIEMNNILYVPYRLPSGSHVAIFRMGHFDIERGTAEQWMTCTLTIVEMILECEATQVCGGVLVLDLKDMTFRHYRQFATLHFVTFLISALQDIVPERLKAIHILHEPLIASSLFNAMRPILKKKMKERIHFHGKSMQSLHKFVPKDFLTKEYEGKLGPFDNTDFAKYFYSQEEFVKRSFKYGLVKTGK